jgi:pyrophosphatase PpaX
VAYRTYLFDLDGTLIDSVELILASHRHTRRVHFGDSLPDAQFIAAMGRPLRDIYADFATDAIAVEAMIATYRSFNVEHHDRMVSAYPGIASLLSQLAERGARLAVVTSKLADLARRGLRVTGLDGFFPIVIGADDVTRGKPDPQPVFRALDALGADAEGAVMVGDSTHDLQAGRRAGIRTAAALWGPFERSVLAAEGPDHFLAHPEELLEHG